MFFESHAHYDDPRFDTDRNILLASMNANGIKYVVNAGADIRSSQAGIRLAGSYDFMYAAVGVHPHEADGLNNHGLELLRELACHEKVVAIGEIGLDYYYDNSSRESQLLWFERQLALAYDLGLPVIIHSRDAAAQTLDTIKAGHVRDGVIHCFSGSPEMAQEYIKLGFYIGIGGVITFPKSRVTLEVVSAIPLSKILIETDCPYLSPVPNRGKRNDSSNLKYIAAKIAEVKKISIDETAYITMHNAMDCFRINAQE